MTSKQKNHSANGFNVTKLVLILFLGIFLCAEGYFGWRLHQLSDAQENIKGDYCNINSIRFGLFSVEQWRDDVTHIVNHQVRHFKLTAEQKHELQVEVEEILIAVIDKAEELINKPQTTMGGKIKKLAVKTFVNTDKIKAQVPDLAKEVIAKVYNRDNKNKLSKMALQKFNQVQKNHYIDSSTTASDSLTALMYNKYNVTSHKDFDNKLTAALENIRTTTYNYSFAMLGCVVIVLMLWWLLRKRVDLHATLFVMSLMFAFILLSVGLTASMIEVDARIQSFDFVFLGEHVVFKNQVMFFQSKSILDVVEVLVKQPGIDSICVGILILVFSIIFPIMKLSSTGIHLLSQKKLAENKIIKYFAFQSGKWSMADVIVIAILMTYIGLNGLLENKLANLNLRSDFLTIISTNNTALQPGYIIFICFVLYGLILSTILKSITPYDSN